LKALAKGNVYTIETIFEILKVLRILEETGKEPSTKDIAELLKKDYSVVLRYRNTMEKAGLITVEPEYNKNIVKLTDLGRCIAMCLSKTKNLSKT